MAGRFFLHLDGGVPDVEGAGVEELFHGVAELLAGGVVDVGFEEDDVVLPAGEGPSFDRPRMSGGL